MTTQGQPSDGWNHALDADHQLVGLSVRDVVLNTVAEGDWDMQHPAEGYGAQSEGDGAVHLAVSCGYTWGTPGINSLYLGAGTAVVEGEGCIPP